MALAVVSDLGRDLRPKQLFPTLCVGVPLLPWTQNHRKVENSVETRSEIEAKTTAGEQPVGSAASTVSGFLADLLETWGIRQGADPVDLVSIAFGAELVNQGVLLEGLRMWKRVAKWGATEIALARKTADPARLTNAIAEQLYGAFGKGDCYGLPGLAAGAILGENAARVSSFYEEETEFLTRVVGLKHESRMDVLEDLTVGEQLFLVWEQENPYDSKALAVVTKTGHRIGYIRRTIARTLVARIKAGTGLLAKVELVLGEGYDINERVWVRVQAVPESGLPVPRLQDSGFDPSTET